MKRLSILTLLLFLVLTASYAQIGINPSGDTIVCYNTIEARKIAKKLVQAKECDKLLDATTKEVSILEKIISTKDEQLVNSDSIAFKHETIITNNEDYIIVLQKSLKKSERKVKLLKAGWASTAIISAVGVILLLIR